MRRLLLIGLLVLAACGDDDAEDLPPTPGDLGTWQGIDTPDGWGEVITRCVGPIRLFVGLDDTYASSAVAATLDPTCPTGES